VRENVRERGSGENAIKEEEMNVECNEGEGKVREGGKEEEMKETRRGNDARTLRNCCRGPHSQQAR